MVNLHKTSDWEHVPNNVPSKIIQIEVQTDSIWWFDWTHSFSLNPILSIIIRYDCPPDVCIKARVFQATGHDQWSRPCRDDGENRQPRDNMGASAVLPRPQDMWNHGVKVSKWWARHNFYGDKRMG